MSELTVETRDVEDVGLLYPRGFINAHTVRLFEGEIQKALERAALQDRGELAGARLHRERGAGRDHGRDRGDPRERRRHPLAELNETVRNIFEILGFNHLYRIFPSEMEAILSFRGERTPREAGARERAAPRPSPPSCCRCRARPRSWPWCAT